MFFRIRATSDILRHTFELPGVVDEDLRTLRFIRERFDQVEEFVERLRVSRRKDSPSSSLDRNTDGVAPFRPTAVIVADILIAEQIRQRKPGVAAPLAYAAVGNNIV